MLARGGSINYASKSFIAFDISFNHFNLKGMFEMQERNRFKYPWASNKNFFMVVIKLYRGKLGCFSLVVASTLV
jgi:hypothetical protein